MSTLLLVTDGIAVCNTASDLASKGRASSLSTTKTGFEVGHPLSRFPQMGFYSLYLALGGPKLAALQTSWDCMQAKMTIS